MKFSLLAPLALLASEVDARFKFMMCPNNVDYMKLDQAKWEGNWYEIQRDMMFPMEIGAECVTQNFKQRADGNMEFFYRGYYWYYFFQYTGVGGQLQDCDSGSPVTQTCKATMNLVKSGKRSNWKLLSTDYDNYAIMYSCSNQMSNVMHAEYFTVLGRETTLSDEIMEKVRKIVKDAVPDYDMSDANMVTTVQGDSCKYDLNEFDA